MSGTDFKTFRKQQQDNAPDQAQTWESVVTAAPATQHDLVRVRAVHGARGRAGIEFGLAPWVPPSTKERPEEGDLCLVQLDEQGAPWVVGWKEQGSNGSVAQEVPTHLLPNEQYTLHANKQALWTVPILVEGTMNIFGTFVEVE